MSMDELSFKKRPADDEPLAMDPPILVGGGGSTYVWLRLDVGSQSVDPGSDDPTYGIKPGSKKPKNRNNYSCHRNNDSPNSVIFCDGVGGEVVLNIKNKNKWYIRCED